MNVIVSNKYQLMLENLGIDVIKNLNVSQFEAKIDFVNNIRTY